jgi:hypothetical protein
MMNLALPIIIVLGMVWTYNSGRHGLGEMPDWMPSKSRQVSFEDRLQVSVRPLRFATDHLALGLGQMSTVPIDSLLQVEVVSLEADDYDIFVTCAGKAKEQYPTKWLPFHSQPAPGCFGYINFLVRKPDNDSLVVVVAGKQGTLTSLFTGFSNLPPEGGGP